MPEPVNYTDPDLCPDCGRNMTEGELHTADCAQCNVCGHACGYGVDDDGNCPCCRTGASDGCCIVVAF